MKKHKPDILIGIDTGVNTGFAELYTSDRLLVLHTWPIHKALYRVYELLQDGATLHVKVEDARTATFGRQKDMHRAQGAGSVKRDAVIWEEFLNDMESRFGRALSFDMVRPKKRTTKGNAKLDIKVFEQLTGYKGRTSVHARDAAFLIY